MPEKQTYRVVLHGERSIPNDLGEMTEIEMYAYVRTRIDSMHTVERVLQDLQVTNRATTFFEPLFGSKIRVEIRRVTPRAVRR